MKFNIKGWANYICSSQQEMLDKADIFIKHGFFINDTRYINQFEQYPCIAFNEEQKRIIGNYRSDVFPEFSWEEICFYFKFSTDSKVNQKCICERYILVNSGCRCGAFSKELEREEFS